MFLKTVFSSSTTIAGAASDFIGVSASLRIASLSWVLFDQLFFK
jgi:hypothetical protein